MPRRYSNVMHKDSVGALLQDAPPQSERRRRSGGSGGTPKNYRQDNRTIIKEIQAQNRQRKQQEAAPAAEPFKLEQFKNIKSRFNSTPTPERRQSVPGSSENSPSLVAGHTFLRRGSREKAAKDLRHLDKSSNINATTTTTTTTTPSSSKKRFGTTNCWNGPVTPTATTPSTIAASTTRARPASSSGGSCDDRCLSFDAGGDMGEGTYRFSTPRKDPVPRASDVAKLAPRSARDFVASNRLKAAEMKTKNVSEQEQRFTHDSYGRVPDYLLSRQEEWEREEEKRKAEAPDPSCPPGMKLMPEEERLSTLKLLAENEASCQAQLNKFPLVVQTPLLQRRVDELNTKLKEIDGAKMIFNRPRVYIARDS